MVVVRPAVLPKDAAGIGAIGTSFTTSQVYDVDASADSIRLTIRDLEGPFCKRFPLDDLESPTRPYDRAWVAVDGERIVGFAAIVFEPWNDRLILWHLYVDPASRGRGVASRLLETVKDHGRERGARHLWLETSSLTAPGHRRLPRLGLLPDRRRPDLVRGDAGARRNRPVLFPPPRPVPLYV